MKGGTNCNTTLNSNKLIFSESHDSTVWNISFDKTGTRLASCSDDRTIKIWQSYQPGNEQGTVASKYTMSKMRFYSCFNTK